MATKQEEKMSLLRLLIKEGPQAGSVLHKDGPALQVGRTKASQLMIKDPSISEKHAVFAWRNGRWELRDLGSSNGTTLNGVALEREGEFVPVSHGDSLMFGTETVITVEMDAAAVEEMSVEEFLEAECNRLQQEIRAKAEKLGESLMEKWAAEKKSLSVLQD